METDDLKRVVKLIDKIIVSERREVKQAFQELLLMVALTEDGAIAGPLEKMVDKMQDVIRNLDGRIRNCERPTWDGSKSRDWYERMYTNKPDPTNIWGKGATVDSEWLKNTYIKTLGGDENT